MRKGDAILEKGAERLQELSDRAAATGGTAAKLAKPLAEDAALLRRLKPSLVAARIKGDAPTDLEPGSGATVAPVSHGKGPSPFLVIGAALAGGIVLAKILDWRGHAHPRG